MRSSFILPAVVALLSLVPTAASAAEFRFDRDPFRGSTALTTPGRQVVGINEVQIPLFDVSTDVASFVLSAFGYAFDEDIAFYNGTAAGLPLAGGLNVIVLQDIDFDGNPANGNALNAGQAATLIANAIDISGAGLFVYFNTALNVNRLVFSTDLADPTADLAILARFLNQSGPAGIDDLPRYTAANFATVPAPAALGLFGLGFAALRLRRR